MTRHCIFRTVQFFSAAIAIFTAQSVCHAADAPRGKDLFRYCVTCHGDNGHGQQLGTVRIPAIAGLSAWYVEGQLIKFRENIRGAHADDSSGLLMRPMAKTLASPEDVKAVAAYVETLPQKPSVNTVTGDLQRGKTIYANVCAACHGDKMQGNTDPLVHAPSQKPLDAWYMADQLRKFKGGIRGAHAKDVDGAKMLPIVQGVLPSYAQQLNITEDEAINDVIAYIYSNRN